MQICVSETEINIMLKVCADLPNRCVTAFFGTKSKMTTYYDFLLIYPSFSSKPLVAIKAAVDQSQNLGEIIYFLKTLVK